MNVNAPVYTTENECQDCYKCVRHCHCKAIRIVNAKASVIPEACVACGECIKVCPAHAKKIRSDYSRLKKLMSDGQPIYASVAPSFVGYFKGIKIEQLAAALIKSGFSGVSETALGAEALSSKTCEFLKHTKKSILISSACPASVDYIRKYIPQYSDHIVPLLSPVLSHCQMLKEHFGENIHTVFFGPCAAKKNESDRHPELLDLALTFSTLEQWLKEKKIVIDQSKAEVVPRAAEEGRFYSIEGGMNDTLRGEDKRIRYITVSGLENLGRLLGSTPVPCDEKENIIFIETLACHSGCINGPVMPSQSSSIDSIIQTNNESSLETSEKRKIKFPLSEQYNPSQIEQITYPESEIASALARVNKFTKSDELNCGACGYNTCRDFAQALIAGKAEEAMCHNYLRKNFQRTSNALIKYIPSGVVIINHDFEITESNRHFAEIVDGTVIFDSLGSLNAIRIDNFLPEFFDLFESVMSNGGEIEKYNQPYTNKLINLSVFSIAKGKFVGAILQDVTKPELKREQIAEKAQEVIRKNVLTVQEVARIFGEHIAESEILLKEIAGSYKSMKEIKKDE